MRDVAIVGAGMTPCRSRWVEKTFWELGQMAVAEAVHDAGIHIREVQAGVAGIYNDIFEFQAIPECGLQGIIGLANKPMMRVSNGGATGAYSMLAAYNLIASGQYDLVLVLGVEKALDCYDFEAQSPTPAVVQTIGYSWDPWFERPLGAHASESYAEVVQAYMDEHPGDLDPRARARIVELLSDHAQNNPYAQRLGERVTADQVLRSRYVVYPIRALETCVYTEGACALVFASQEMAEEIAGRTGREPIWIAGVGAANEPYFVGRDIERYKVLHRIYSDYLATQQALKQARLTIDDMQVIELHDAYIPQLMITLAEMGVVPLGRANDLVEEGIIMPGGRLLVNPSGGLVFAGHFVGGSNMMSTWSVMREMRARDLDHGMIHGTGSSLSMYGVVMILERRA
ncbi:MAG: thiolase family protein [Candidatus Tectomicrobia bacterium]|uniref:Thiolase family protein n=1 Tax=Tectimicrobiota bacterium TaxID=2528274 RepID=A0A932FZJ8_UNCTE|nr:thiolase family protein [Candidatus Tectomicrobia bacterium]